MYVLLLFHLKSSLIFFVSFTWGGGVEIRNHTLKTSTIGRKKDHNSHGLANE